MASRKKQGRLAFLKTARKELILVGVTVLVCLILGELMLRLFRSHVIGTHQHPTSVGRDDILADNRLGQHHPQIGWTLRPNHTVTNHNWEFKHTISTNSKGQRDDENRYERRPGVRRVLLLGDSFAMGDGVERGDLFADVLEETLPATEVINTAVSGYGTDQELITYMIEGKKYHADVVLLAITLGNDLKNNVAREQYGAHKPYFVLEGGELELMGIPVPETHRKAALVESQLRSPFPVHDFLDANSAIYATSFEALSRIPSLRRRWEEKNLLYRQETVYYQWQVGVLRSPPTPNQEAAWQLTLEILKRWREETVAENSTPVLVIIPSHLQVYPEIWERAVDEFNLQPGRFYLDYPNERLTRFCGSIDLRVIDLLPDFRVAAKAGARLYYKRNPHWVREGHHLAAEIIARELTDMDVLP